MSTTILTPDIIRHRIKGATRDLIRLCGGIERCAQLTGYSDTQASRWQCPGETATIPLPAVVVLEADCGLPTVTSALAALNGRTVAAPESPGDAMRRSILANFACVTAKSAAMQSAVSDALADRIVTPAEAEIIARTIGDMISSGQRFHQDMAVIKARGGADLTEQE